MKQIISPALKRGLNTAVISISRASTTGVSSYGGRFAAIACVTQITYDSESLFRGKTLHRLLNEFVHILFELVPEFCGVSNLL